MDNNDLKAGDILLFSGKGFISNFIKLGTMSKWSHVGIMLDEEHLVESTTLSNLEDCVVGKNISGVQIVKIEERIKTYEGKIAVKKLKKELSNKKEEDLYLRAMELHGRPYEENNWELIKSGIDWLPSTSDNLESVFCSELVAELLHSGGIYYNPKTKANDYSPYNISKVVPEKYEALEVL